MFTNMEIPLQAGGDNVNIPYEHYYITQGKPSSKKIVCTDKDGNTFKPTILHVKLSDTSAVTATYDGTANATTYFQTPQNSLYASNTTNTIKIESDGFSVNDASYALMDSTTIIMAFA